MTERPSLPQGDKIRKIPPQEITQNDMPIPPQGWQPYSVEDDTIDLMELLTTLWRYKWLLILLPIFGIIGSYSSSISISGVSVPGNLSSNFREWWINEFRKVWSTGIFS